MIKAGYLKQFVFWWNIVYASTIIGVVALVVTIGGVPFNSFKVIYYLSVASVVLVVMNIILWRKREK